MALGLGQLVSLAQAQALRQTRLAEQAAATAGRLWDATDGIDDAAQASYSRQAARALAPMRLASVRATQGYLAVLERQAVGTATELGSPADVLAQVRAGLPLEDLYARPFVTARVAISEGKSYAEARALGKARAETIADTDITLSQNLAAKDYMQRSPRIAGHRRVPDAGACNYCLMASTQRYKVAELQPIHPKCHCQVMPIFGSKDPGQVIDKGLLANLKGKQAKTVDNLELGPVFQGVAPRIRTQRTVNAGHISASEGHRIARAANAMLAGKITRKEYLATVREIRNRYKLTA